MKKVNPYLSNGASIFISIVAALQRVWQREIKPRADRYKGSSRCLSGRRRKDQASIEGVSVATPQTQVLSPARVRVSGGLRVEGQQDNPAFLHPGSATCQTDARSGQGIWTARGCFFLFCAKTNKQTKPHTLGLTN